MCEPTSSIESSATSSVDARDDHGAADPPSTSSPVQQQVESTGSASHESSLLLDNSQQSSHNLDHTDSSLDRHRHLLSASNDEDTTAGQGSPPPRSSSPQRRPSSPSPRSSSPQHRPSSLSPRSSSPQHRPSSPYVMIEGTRHPVLNTSSFESTGLMYAHDLVLVESDEVNTESATDVLQQRAEIEDSDGNDDETLASVSIGSHNRSLLLTGDHDEPPVDLSVLMDLEALSNQLGGELDSMMTGLRTSLHAMTVCAHQGISLQRETAENLQLTVDINVKAMYTFLSKFSELHHNLKPVTDISRQIHEINERLKTLEKLF